MYVIPMQNRGTLTMDIKHWSYAFCPLWIAVAWKIYESWKMGTVITFSMDNNKKAILLSNTNRSSLFIDFTKKLLYQLTLSFITNNNIWLG